MRIHVKKKMYRAHVRTMVLDGKVSMPSGDWTSEGSAKSFPGYKDSHHKSSRASYNPR